MLVTVAKPQVKQPSSSQTKPAQLINHCRLVTDAGLMINDIVRTSTRIPVLPLPILGHLNDPHSTAATIDRNIDGVVLDDVWFELSTQMKYQYTRQLRKIV